MDDQGWDKQGSTVIVMEKTCRTSKPIYFHQAKPMEVEISKSSKGIVSHAVLLDLPIPVPLNHSSLI